MAWSEEARRAALEARRRKKKRGIKVHDPRVRDSMAKRIRATRSLSRKESGSAYGKWSEKTRSYHNIAKKGNRKEMKKWNRETKDVGKYVI